MLTRVARLYKNSFSGLPPEIWLISLVTLINRSGAMVIPFLTVYLTQKLGFSLMEAGWVMSAFGAGSVLGSYLGGKLTDRYGHYEVQFWSLMMSGVMFFLLMQMEQLWSFALLTFCTSFVADIFRPANMASISAYSPQNLYTRSVALLRFAINLGFSLGPALGGLIAAYAGYKWLFVMDGLTCMMAAVLFRLFVPNKEEEIPVEKHEDGKIPPKFSILNDRPFLLFALFQLITSIAFLQFLSTIPVFMKENLMLQENAIGLLMALNGILIVIVEMPLVYLAENRFSKLKMVFLGSLLIGGTYVFLGLGNGLAGIAVMYILGITFGEMINFPFGNSWALERSAPGTRGKYMGLYSMIFSISLIISPTLGTTIADQMGFSWLWLILGTMALFAAAGVYLLNLRTESPKTG